MSVMYCHYCHLYIDTDYDVEHFTVDEETQCFGKCIKQIEDEEGEAEE